MTIWLTWCLVVVGAFQAWWLFGTLAATAKAADTAERALFDLERADIFPSALRYSKMVKADGQARHSVRLNLTNYGRLLGVIDEVTLCAETKVFENREARSGETSVKILQGMILSNGEGTKEISFIINEPVASQMVDVERFALVLYFNVSVAYTDNTGAIHSTALTFEFDPKERTFSLLSINRFDGLRRAHARYGQTYSRLKSDSAPKT